jgi:pimeloyl-ACP methyl ester carboxylesterase
MTASRTLSTATHRSLPTHKNPLPRTSTTTVPNPGARFEVVAGARHLVNLERPDRFNELLLDLLAGLTPHT